jgi:hypothetical protein
MGRLAPVFLLGGFLTAFSVSDDPIPQSDCPRPTVLATNDGGLATRQSPWPTSSSIATKTYVTGFGNPVPFGPVDVRLRSVSGPVYEGQIITANGLCSVFGNNWFLRFYVGYVGLGELWSAGESGTANEYQVEIRISKAGVFSGAAWCAGTANISWMEGCVQYWGLRNVASDAVLIESEVLVGPWQAQIDELRSAGEEIKARIDNQNDVINKLQRENAGLKIAIGVIAGFVVLLYGAVFFLCLNYYRTVVMDANDRIETAPVETTPLISVEEKHGGPIDGFADLEQVG